MEQRGFGQTGLQVSALGFGAGQVGDEKVSEHDAERLLNAVLDEGITLIDTARGYGLSEERIGKYISHRRNEFVLSTKVGYGITGYEDWTYDCILAGVDEALRLLKTDYIDIVHLHSCPVETLRKGDVIRALEDVKQAGKIRVAAYSGDNEHLNFAIESGRFGSVETSINMCDQRVISDGLAKAAQKGLGVIAKRPIANAPWRFEERPVGHYCELYWERLREMGLDPGMFAGRAATVVRDTGDTSSSNGSASVAWNELALRFTAYQPGVHSCIVGTTSVDHLRQNIRVLEHGPLDPDTVAQIRSRFEAHDRDWVGLT
ncbi:aldo/keto reductase [Alicyclobacillus ferrooxydans]|uniref:aldo/keto reductase n=1 Tax=Alicyclobacillus ferrooxydans TaxID=471514 RepID=UPI000AEC265D|nr:aldo/keto reductase [Alicyclobacillus ferrooxydans]